MRASRNFESIFEHVYDTVIIGAGYAGLAAARELADQPGSVLLISDSMALCWESAWAMNDEAGVASHTIAGSTNGWPKWIEHLVSRGASDGHWIDAGPSEVLAGVALSNQANLEILLGATPVATELDNGLLVGVTLAVRAGLRRVVGRRFIDTSERADLLRLLPGAPLPRKPIGERSWICFQRREWHDQAQQMSHIKSKENIGLTWRHSHWPNQRRLQIDLPAQGKSHREYWIEALNQVHQLMPEALVQSIVTHASVVALPVYDDSASSAPESIDAFPRNVTSGCASLSTGPMTALAHRYEAGTASARRLASLPMARPHPALLRKSIDIPQLKSQLHADVCVAGLGTGGLLAAISASRAGASVLAFDPLPFAGGISTGGGIHIYYHGVKGGLQEELDERVRKIMPLFGTSAQIRGFHPDAKKLVADQMLRESGAKVVQGFITHAHAQSGRLLNASICIGNGLHQIHADNWIDATGDADLAALAGAAFSMGRTSDGQLHAYSQSSGRASDGQLTTQMYCINFDSGFVDPTDAQDVSRARLNGLKQYEHPRYTQHDHPTCIAPMIGVRQARHVHTDYVLTLSDLIEHRAFADAVGYTAAHYDNHAIDYELESDEALFWTWVCCQWRRRTGCQIPYRILLPRSFNNLWIACRALGVSFDAHSSMRMQRDMQRVGEVAGLAAALACRDRTDSRGINHHELRAQLEASGALRHRTVDDDPFGSVSGTEGLATGETTLPNDQAISKWIQILTTSNDPSDAPWHLYRAGVKACGETIAMLAASTDPDGSWYASTVLAMWSDPRAQTRLLESIRTREYGFEKSSRRAKPESSQVVVPRWVTAIALLRTCADPRALAILLDLAADAQLPLNIRTSIALTTRRILNRFSTDPRARSIASQIGTMLLASPLPMEFGPPQRALLRTQPEPAPTHGWWTPQVSEPLAWSMHLQIGALRLALGLAPHPQAVACHQDPRLIVRNSAARLLGSVKATQPVSRNDASMPLAEGVATP